MAAKKTPSPKLPAPKIVPTTSPTVTSPTLHTLESMAKGLPAPDAALLAAIVATATREEFVRAGAKIASARIVTDAQRLLSIAYDAWHRATPSQQELLVGFSPELLALAIDRARALRTLEARYRTASTSAKAELAGTEAERQGAFAHAFALRAQARTVLHTVVGRDAARRATIDAAVGTAETHEDLAAALDRLAALVAALLAERAPSVVAGRTLARLTPAFGKKLADAAGELRAAAAAAATYATTADRAAQAELDYLDGVNLHLLGDILHAFADAHALDATIPELVPIATRRMLGKGGRRGKAKDAHAPTPTTPTVTDGGQ